MHTPALPLPSATAAHSSAAKTVAKATPKPAPLAPTDSLARKAAAPTSAKTELAQKTSAGAALALRSKAALVEHKSLSNAVALGRPLDMHGDTNLKAALTAHFGYEVSDGVVAVVDRMNRRALGLDSKQALPTKDLRVWDEAAIAHFARTGSAIPDSIDPQKLQHARTEFARKGAAILTQTGDTWDSIAARCFPDMALSAEAKGLLVSLLRERNAVPAGAELPAAVIVPTDEGLAQLIGNYRRKTNNLQKQTLDPKELSKTAALFHVNPADIRSQPTAGAAYQLKPGEQTALAVAYAYKDQPEMTPELLAAATQIIDQNAGKLLLPSFERLKALVAEDEIAGDVPSGTTPGLAPEVERKAYAGIPLRWQANVLVGNFWLMTAQATPEWAQGLSIEQADKASKELARGLVESHAATEKMLSNLWDARLGGNLYDFGLTQAAPTSESKVGLGANLTGHEATPPNANGIHVNLTLQDNFWNTTVPFGLEPKAAPSSDSIMFQQKEGAATKPEAATVKSVVFRQDTPENAWSSTAVPYVGISYGFLNTSNKIWTEAMAIENPSRQTGETVAEWFKRTQPPMSEPMWAALKPRIDELQTALGKLESNGVTQIELTRRPGETFYQALTRTYGDKIPTDMRRDMAVLLTQRYGSQTEVREDLLALMWDPVQGTSGLGIADQSSVKRRAHEEVDVVGETTKPASSTGSGAQGYKDATPDALAGTRATAKGRLKDEGLDDRAEAAETQGQRAADLRDAVADFSEEILAKNNFVTADASARADGAKPDPKTNTTSGTTRPAAPRKA